MERKLSLFTFVVLFATFGSIESRWHSGWENRGSSAPSPLPWGHNNGTLPNRPWNVQISPPRYSNTSWSTNDGRIPYIAPSQPSRICNGSGSSNWPCGPSDTVQPAAYAGSRRNDSYPSPRHGYNDNVGLRHRPYPYGGSSSNYHASNRTNGTPSPSYRPLDRNRNNSTRLYPLLPGSGHDSSNAGYGTVLNGTRTRPTIPQYHGNSGFPNYNPYPSQTNPSGQANGNGY